MAFTNPAVADFQAYFFRDFPYQPPSLAVPDLKFVQPQDITNAIAEADAAINPGLWCDQATYTLAFLLLAAHQLVLALRNASQGVGSEMDWLHTNKAAGPVNEAFAIPERIMANPQWAALCRTGYGGKYLLMVLPRSMGVMFTVQGRTKP